MSDLLSRLGRETRGGACDRWMRLLASLCTWAGELGRAEQEATAAIALERQKREMLVERLLAVDTDEPRYRGVLDLLIAAAERTHVARTSLDSVARERAALITTEAEAVGTVLADLLANAESCSGPTVPRALIMTAAGAN
jgi:hypothetical protein